MNKLDKIFSTSVSPMDYAREYNNYLSEVLSAVVDQSFNDYIDILLSTAANKNTIYIIGNGGSAATASHYANDINYGVRDINSGLKAVSLTDNVAVLTALANDIGYEYVFSKQLEKFLIPGDIVIAISASGNSGNIVNAVELTQSKGNVVVGISGFDGGYLAQHADISLLIPSNKGEYGPVEDAHSIIGHITGTYLARHFSE